MNELDLVKIAIRYMGKWSSSTTYEALDYVYLEETGCGYVSLVANSNVKPGTDASKWALSASKGASGHTNLDTKIIYSSSDEEVSNMAWDAIHVFPTMDNLSVSLASVPVDNEEHTIKIEFQTPADIDGSDYEFDSDINWVNDYSVVDGIMPSTKYEVIISSVGMLGMFSILNGSKTPRKMDVLEDVAIPIGGSYKAQFISNLKQTLVEYSSSNSSVATVDSNGMVRGVSSGNATITVSWANLMKSITVHVGAEVIDTTSIPAQDRTIDEVVIINPRATLEEGDEYALYAVGLSNNLSPKYDIGYYNPIKFTSSNPNVATVQFGTLMAVGQGTCTITASDLNDNATDSFSLTVTAQHIPTATEEETYVPVIDNTGATDVTEDIAEAFAYASQNGYKKISFPQGSYLMNGDNRPDGAPIQFPSNMIVDFNGSNMYFEVGDATIATYTMFQIKGVQNVWLRNLNVFAENYNQSTLLHKEGCRTIQITGMSKNIHIEDCVFSWSPGFNVTLAYIRNTSYPGENPQIDFSLLTLNNIEAGGFDAYGEPATASNTWRSTNYMQFNCRTGGWVFGMFEGYQAQYIRSLLYDIYFYDANHEFMYRKQNCYRYQRYELESATKPSYCKVAFFQESAPTEAYGGENLAWICDRQQPVDVYFKNCVFRNAQSTGLSPQGGEHVVVDNCQFIDNGYHDPYAHIDWEDGRQSSQGHIIKNCTFSLETLNNYYNGHYVNGQVENLYCTNITLHDNMLNKSYYRTGDSSFSARTFHNVFIGDSPTLSTSEEAVFAGNLLDMQPTFSEPWFRAKYIDVDNEVHT